MPKRTRALRRCVRTGIPSSDSPNFTRPQISKSVAGTGTIGSVRRGTTPWATRSKCTGRQRKRCLVASSCTFCARMRRPAPMRLTTDRGCSRRRTEWGAAHSSHCACRSARLIAHTVVAGQCASYSEPQPRPAHMGRYQIKYDDGDTGWAALSVTGASPTAHNPCRGAGLRPNPMAIL